METIAFFLSTLSLAVTSSSNTPRPVQAVPLRGAGTGPVPGAGVFLRNLDRAKKIRWLMAAGAIGLLSLTVVLYLLGLTGTKYGAANWLTIAGISVQPSELAKICYIFAGAATLDRLFPQAEPGPVHSAHRRVPGLSGLYERLRHRRHLLCHLPGYRLPPLRRLGHPGPHLRRRGVCGAHHALPSKPYILQRFATWGHAWQNASVGSGYQQTRTMSAAASGGLVGVGPGEGWLHTVGAGTPTWCSACCARSGG